MTRLAIQQARADNGGAEPSASQLEEYLDAYDIDPATRSFTGGRERLLELTSRLQENFRLSAERAGETIRQLGGESFQLPEQRARRAGVVSRTLENAAQRQGLELE